MNDDTLFERLRALLLWYGPQKINDLCEKLPDISRKRILKILEDNPYSFDFKMIDLNKKWYIN